MNRVVIAIDGPAASGKSTVAREVASRLNFIYVNTGDMYRAATWVVLNREINPADTEAATKAVRSADLECVVHGGRSCVKVDGQERDEELRSDAVNASVSAVARIPEVREILVARQREFANEHSVVMEGRDIGSVVFPETPYKFYIDATPEERARRRAAQGIVDAISERDRADRSREASPLAIAPGATVIDSTGMAAAEVVERVLEELQKRLPSP
jgi:cytidylate kinase